MFLTFPPILAYSEPPKYPLTGAVAAYTKMAVLSIDPRLQIKKKVKSHPFMTDQGHPSLLRIQVP